MVVFSLWNFNAVLSIAVASVKVFPEMKKKGKEQESK